MHKFSFAPLTLLAASLFAAPSLHAQAVLLYGTLTEVHGTNVPQYGYACANLGPCPYSPPYTAVNGLGPGLGMTLNFVRTPGVELGLDFRGSKHVNSNGADTGLAGLKLSIKPPIFHVTTYIQASLGYLGTSTNFSGRTDTSHYGAAEVVGGIDLPILPHFDLRVLEVGAGHSLNRLYSGSKPTFVTASSGIVYHF